MFSLQILYFCGAPKHQPVFNFFLLSDKMSLICGAGLWLLLFFEELNNKKRNY